jgi:hypothetical protein
MQSSGEFYLDSWLLTLGSQQTLNLAPMKAIIISQALLLLRGLTLSSSFPLNKERYRTGPFAFALNYGL